MLILPNSRDICKGADCLMKVSIQLELTSGTSAIARAAALMTKSLTDSLYSPPDFWLRLARTLRVRGESEGREGEYG